jgi:CheY-like chemotaxis protein
VRVLVVDDEFLVGLFVSSMLEDLGCEVETALHGNEALGKLADDPRIKLLITDINMPGLSGYEVAERAQRMRPGLKVILLSGAETDPRGLPLIRKPFRRSDLTRVMEATTGIC